MSVVFFSARWTSFLPSSSQYSSWPSSQAPRLRSHRSIVRIVRIPRIARIPRHPHRRARARAILRTLRTPRPTSTRTTRTRARCRTQPYQLSPPPVAELHALRPRLPRPPRPRARALSRPRACIRENSPSRRRFQTSRVRSLPARPLVPRTSPRARLASTPSRARSPARRSRSPLASRRRAASLPLASSPAAPARARRARASTSPRDRRSPSSRARARRLPVSRASDDATNPKPDRSRPARARPRRVASLRSPASLESRSRASASTRVDHCAARRRRARRPRSIRGARSVGRSPFYPGARARVTWRSSRYTTTSARVVVAPRATGPIATSSSSSTRDRGSTSARDRRRAFRVARGRGDRAPTRDRVAAARDDDARWRRRRRCASRTREAR